MAYPRKNPSIRPVPRKLFDKTGRDIKSVFDLEYDQDIWLSFGEPWRTPYSQLLSFRFRFISIVARGLKIARLCEAEIMPVKHDTAVTNLLRHAKNLN